MNRVIYNGQSVDSIPADSRGLAYGDGLFETLRFTRHKAPLWHLHMTRLKAGCETLGLEAPAVNTLQDESLNLVNENGPGIIKLIIWRRSTGRGYAGPSRDHDRLLQWFALPAKPQPVELVPLTIRLAAQPKLAGVKHLNRLEQVLAANELESLRNESGKASDGLMLDQAGLPIESVSANIFAVCDEQLLTPALENCGVAGVLRQALLEQTGLCLRITKLTMDELESADEVFLGNSVRGIVPVVQFRQRRWEAGPLSSAIGSWFEAMFNDNVQR